jgi:hypothetical protein
VAEVGELGSEQRELLVGEADALKVSEHTDLPRVMMVRRPRVLKVAEHAHLSK